MQTYSTGEIAKNCNVSVRTVQYYDKIGLLKPSNVTEGGRREYTDNDKNKLQTICFLTEIGLSLKTIKKVFEENTSAKFIDYLLAEQKKVLKQEIERLEAKVQVLDDLKKFMNDGKADVVDSLLNARDIMENKRKMKRFYTFMVLFAVIMVAVEVCAIISAVYNYWVLFGIGVSIVIILAMLLSIYYFKKVAYVCPQCRKTFKPSFKKTFFASHTLTTRKLTCPHCNYNGYCLETLTEKENKK